MLVRETSNKLQICKNYKLRNTKQSLKQNNVIEVTIKVRPKRKIKLGVLTLGTVRTPFDLLCNSPCYTNFLAGKLVKHN